MKLPLLFPITKEEMDEAYSFMKKHGYDAVKTGYVGYIIPRGEHHDSQFMVNHYLWVAERTAENRIMLDCTRTSTPNRATQNISKLDGKRSCTR